MHYDVFLWRMENSANYAKSQGNPWLFLDGISSLHVEWHSDPSTGRAIGFLLFHWHLIEHFRDLHLDQYVRPYYASYFNPGGRFGNQGADWDDSMGSVEPAANIDDLVNNSAAVESWHNSMHHIIEQNTGVPMMDAARNIYYEEFWSFHFFINSFLENRELYNYAESTHPGEFNSPADVVRHIKESYHSSVARI
jgi:hypothetical protein